ncbi:MAG: hypothetical protein ACM33B_02055 [Pseudomonadota bacterium]
MADDLGVPLEAHEIEPVFSPLGDPAHADGVETIYEGYLAHYGRPRAFRPPDDDAALLLGDTLYAAGLARIAALGDPALVEDLSELLARCAALRGEGRDGDGELWAASIALLGSHPLASDRDPRTLAGDAAGADAVAGALAAHAARFG